MAHVLVVDDEKSIRITLREFLKDEGHEVKLAAEAAEALELLEQESFDVVVTDIIMPRITGVQLIRKIHDASPDVQTILMTGEPNLETASEAVRTGAFDYLSKPVGRDEILRVVGQAAKVKATIDKNKRLEEENERYREKLQFMVTEQSKALEQTEIKYQTYISNAPEGIFVSNGQGQYIEVNQAACELTGYSEVELLGLSLKDVLAPASLEAGLLGFTKLREQGFLYDEVQSVKKDGSNFYLSVHAVKIGDERSIAFCNDITERIKSDILIQKNSRAFQILSSCNRALIQKPDEIALLGEICRILVEDGGYRMSWFGKVEENEAKDITPVAQYGFEEGYLKTIKITWADSERGRGPTGTAVREKSSMCCDNILTDSLFAPWREEAQRRGYQSSAAIPVFINQKVMGVINLYSAEPEFFDPQEISLLEEMANDLTLGLEYSRTLENLEIARDEALRYGKIFEESLNEIYIFDAQTMLYDTVNKGALKNIGYSMEELRGMTPVDIKPEFDDRSFAEITADIKYGRREELIFDTVHERKDGTAYNVEVHMQMSRYENRKVFVAMILDVTNKIRAEEQVKQLSAAVSQSPVAIVLTNTDGVIEYLNPAFTRMTGWAEHEALGEHTRILKSGKQAHGFYSDLWNEVVSGKTWSGELQNMRKDGKVYWERMTISPLRDFAGRITHFLAVKEDISEHKKAELELSRHREELEKRVEERTRDLSSTINNLHEEADFRKKVQQKLKETTLYAEKANRAKSDFLANMSHELRTPLNAVLGYTQILKRGQAEPELLNKGLQIIHESGEHLLTLINDILDLSKIEAGKIEPAFSIFHFEDFLNKISDLMRVRAEQKKLEFELKIRGTLPLQVSQDERLLREVLINLVDNAIKYTKEGRVVLEVQALKGSSIHQAGEGVRFRIKDTGIGIGRENINVIFEPFTRQDKLHAEVGGTGLGLSISRKLTSLLGGHLKVRSVLGRGTIFYFTLQLPETKGEITRKALYSREVLGYKGAPRNIMIVDDNQENRDILFFHLSRLGFEVNVATSGIECLANLDIFEPELILLDLRMPGIDGYETARRVRAENEKIQIIAISASADLETREQVGAAGFDGFLGKPFELDILFEQMAEKLKLQWIYPDEHPAVKELPAIPGEEPAQGTLPDENRALLLKYAEMGNPSRVTQELKKLEEQAPELMPLVRELQAFVERFNFDELIKKLSEE